MKPLPLSAWEESKITLHLYLQIIGKIRLALFPKMNHWWHVTLYPEPAGLTTGPIPYKDKLFSISLDFIKHVVIVTTNDGQSESIQLGNLTIAEFYEQLFLILEKLNIIVSIYPNPFDPSIVTSDIPFAKDTTHKTYDKKYINQYWQILANIYPILAKFRGQFTGKSTPVHLYWHTFDLVVTRFSGKKAPADSQMDPVSKEAYSHEVISFGFWPGDKRLPEPAFYSYTYPEPEKLAEQPLQPATAFWHDTGNGSLAILKYHDWLKAQDLEKTLLNFLESAYLAGAELAKWPINDLKLNQ